MNKNEGGLREGSLEAPTRHALDWTSPEFYNEDKLKEELERVFDICHGCRRCVSLCASFPTLFDLVDESPTMELDGVDKADYSKVVDECFLCDLCYQAKCPYVPPHEWAIDYPHLMLRAKAIEFHKGKRKLSLKIISNTDGVSRIATKPGISSIINASNKNKTARKLLEKTLDIHRDAHLPQYHSNTLRKRMKNHQSSRVIPQPAGPTLGRIALFATCYCNANEPSIAEDLVKVFQHNDIPVHMISKERCCGMPKLEQGDLQSVDKYRQVNIPQMLAEIDAGRDIVAAIPSCVLMFKQELPLMFPKDKDVQRVKQHIFDPFEYLLHRHKAGLLKTNFKQSLGKIAWHVPCHQRVQNIGPKTKNILALIPDTEIQVIERCSGHDGTYGVRRETYKKSQKIARATISRVKRADADYLVSDCPMAATQIADGLQLKNPETSPLTLLRMAYGLN
ncbi:MAG: Fe-S oxidoreductase [Proteobacteria bacterium]|nr:Fe-S oxidoreductase [Pseudomonadota bacterium]